MSPSKRYNFQIILWFGIWGAFWFFSGAHPKFIVDNGLAFVFQTLLLAGLIFYAAPLLLFKKKYAYFIVASLAAILVCAWISSPKGGPPPHPPQGLPFPHPDNLRRPPGRLPSPFFIHFLVLSFSYILATFLETFWFAQKKEEETVRNKNENLQTELKLLKSQINPHFLFNSLNNIYALSVLDSDKTQQSISNLSDMLRYVLYECEQELVPLDKEIAYIKNYIRLFSLKSSKTYPIKTDFKTSGPAIRVAPMLFIPFIENALKHSHIEKIKDAFINIRIVATGDNIQFEVENNVPSESIHKDAVGGIGLENVRKRLAILYPDRHALTITESLVAFKVNLNIDLNGNH